MSIASLLSRVRTAAAPPPEPPYIPLFLPNRQPHPDDATKADIEALLPEGDHTAAEHENALQRAWGLELERRDGNCARVAAVLCAVSGLTEFTSFCPACRPDLTLNAIGDLNEDLRAELADLRVKLVGARMVLASCAHGCKPKEIADALRRLVILEEQAQRTALLDDNAKAAAAQVSISKNLGPPEPQEWIVPGLVCAGGLTILAGSAGDGKTWVSLGTAVSVATGVPWLMAPVKRRRTLALLLEGARVNIRSRVDKLCAGMKIPFEALEGNLDVWPDTDFKADTPEHIADLVRFIETLDYDYIVIDNLTCARSGGDENNVEAMGRALLPLAEICQKRQIGCLLIHHLNARGELRGSTAIRAHADITFEMQRSTAANNSVITISRIKDRTGESPTTQRLRFNDQYDATRAKIVGVVPTAVKATYNTPESEVADPPPDRPHDEKFDKVLATLPCSTAAMYNRAKLSRNLTVEIRRQLERQGLIAYDTENQVWVRTGVSP